MGIMDKGKAIYESNTVQLVLTGVTVGMAIFSMVNAIIAFSSFQAGKVFHFWDDQRKIFFVIFVIFFLHSQITTKNYTIQIYTATSNYHDLISNWEKPPITDIYVSPNRSCDDGYSLLSTPKWPGTYSDACACPNGALGSTGDAVYSKSGKTCDSNQTYGEFSAKHYGLSPPCVLFVICTLTS
jgi:hypothetical protein